MKGGLLVHRRRQTFNHPLAGQHVKWRDGRRFESVTSNRKSDSVNRWVFTWKTFVPVSLLLFHVCWRHIVMSLYVYWWQPLKYWTAYRGPSHWTTYSDWPTSEMLTSAGNISAASLDSFVTFQVLMSMCIPSGYTRLSVYRCTCRTVG